MNGGIRQVTALGALCALCSTAQGQFGGGQGPQDYDLYPWARTPVGFSPSGIASGKIFTNDFNDDAVLIWRGGGYNSDFDFWAGGEPAFTVAKSQSLRYVAQPPVALPIRPEDVALAHLDGDAHLDLVMVGGEREDLADPKDPDRPLGFLYLYSGNSNGGFTLYEIIEFQQRANSVDVGDFDADGDIDIALTLGIPRLAQEPDGSATGEVVVVENAHPAYSQVFRHTYQAGEVPMDVEFIDLNRDLKLDLAVGRTDFDGGMGQVIQPGRLDIWEWVGAPAVFTNTISKLAAGLPHDVEVEDINGDNAPDVIVGCFQPDLTSNGVGNGINVFPATLGGALLDRVNLYSGPISSIETVDVLRDGTIDIVAGSGIPNPVNFAFPFEGIDPLSAVLHYEGDGSFGFTLENTWSPGQQPTDVVTARAFSSTDNNLLVASGATQSMVTFHGDSINGLELPTQLDTITGVRGAGARRVEAADLDNDGVMDIVSSSVALGGGADGLINVFMGDGSGGYTKTALIQNAESVFEFVLADIDGDGDEDICYLDWSDNTLNTVSNTPSGFVVGTSPLSLGGFPVMIATGDIDGDGDVDLAIADINATGVRLFTNNGSGVFSGAGTVSTGYAIATVGLGDMDGDGDLDLVAGSLNFTGSMLAVSLGDGAGGFGTPVNHTTLGQSRRLELVDLNDDGDLDIAHTVVIGNDPPEGGLEVLFNDGSGGVAAAITRTFPFRGRPFGLASGDVYGNGSTDIVVVDQLTGVLSVHGFLEGGQYNFDGISTHYVTASTSWFVELADMNDDCAPEILTGSAAFASVSIYEHRRDDLFSCGGSLSSGGAPTIDDLAHLLEHFGSMEHDDFNGDGVIDEKDIEQILPLLSAGN